MRVRGLIVFAVILGALRGTTPAQNSTSIFRNTDPAVAYTGSASCVVAGCHEAIGQTYWKNPHGQSMAPANRPQELARVPHAFTVSNPKNHRTYTVYQQGGELYQSVTELDKHGHRLYSQAHKLDYVSGGERTGYSYLYRVGGWMFQAPLSFYAPSKTWELSPGYPADDPGFTRVMTTGCLVCHNGQPDPVRGRDGDVQGSAVPVWRNCHRLRGVPWAGRAAREGDAGASRARAAGERSGHDDRESGHGFRRGWPTTFAGCATRRAMRW